MEIHAYSSLGLCQLFLNLCSPHVCIATFIGVNKGRNIGKDTSFLVFCFAYSGSLQELGGQESLRSWMKWKLGMLIICLKLLRLFPLWASSPGGHTHSRSLRMESVGTQEVGEEFINRRMGIQTEELSTRPVKDQ